MGKKEKDLHQNPQDLLHQIVLSPLTCQDGHMTVWKMHFVLLYEYQVSYCDNNGNHGNMALSDHLNYTLAMVLCSECSGGHVKHMIQLRWTFPALSNTITKCVGRFRAPCWSILEGPNVPQILLPPPPPS